MEMSWIRTIGRRILDEITNLFGVWIRPFLESIAEVLIVTLIGIAPFLLAVIRHNAINDKASEFDIGTVFVSSFSGGQLYLYAFSMLGTLLWLSIFKWTVPQRAYRWFLALVVVLIGFLIVALGGIDPTFSTINNAAIVRLSFYCYGSFVIIYFLLLIGEKEKPSSARKTFREEANALVGKLNNFGEAND
jgi:hypothetical protein